MKHEKLARLRRKRGLSHGARARCRTWGLLACFFVAPTAPLSSAEIIAVSVDRSNPVSVSAFSTGITLVGNSLEFGRNDRIAVRSARSLAARCISWMNCQIMAWGMPDPWPDPKRPAPNEWTSMDMRMRTIVELGAAPIITFCEAPWWMKGKLQRDGSTKLIPDVRGEWRARTYTNGFTDFRGIHYRSGYESPDPYASRVLDNQMGKWLTLVEAVARRYMAAPYNVRHFQVWNELKGYYDPIVKHWAYDDAEGDPRGWNAKHGYTFMFNRVYERLKKVALELGIPPESVKVGGPYPVMVSAGFRPVAGPLSDVSGPWGGVDARSLEVVSYWLAHKVGGEFVTVDGSNQNKIGGEISDLFTRSEKFGAVDRWIRAQPGAGHLAIWWAEWYVRTDSETAAKIGPDSGALENALGAYGALQLISSGATLALLWGGQAETARPPLWTSTANPGGGQARPWYYTYRTLGRLFGSGTVLYAARASSPHVAVMASTDCTLLVNKTGETVRVKLADRIITLGPFEVAFLNAVDGSRRPIEP